MNSSSSLTKIDKNQKPLPRLLRIVKAYRKKKKRINKNILFIKTYLKLKFKKKSISVWPEFCDVTSFVGLRFIGGRKPARKIFWWIWCFIWLVQLALCIWLSSNLFVRYFHYDIKTSTTYDNVDRLPFPAITICNQNTFRRSRIGGSVIFMYYIASFYATNRNDLNNMTLENNRTCAQQNPSSEMTAKVLAASFESLKNLMTLVGPSSLTDVMKCWWNNSEIACNGLFINHATDYSWCYTFNPDQLISRNIDTGSGTAFNEIRKVINAGPQTGLRLLLNANQLDYCGVIHKYSGAGFYVQVHDPAVQASFLSTKYIQLSPGYSYDVSLTPVTFWRNTEHLGKCVSSMYLSLYPNAKTYFVLDCYMQRMTEGVWQKCKCFPFTSIGQNALLANIFGLKLNDVKFCEGEGIICMRIWIENALSQRHKDYFPLCKVPCVETYYDNELSSKKLWHNFFAKNSLTKEKTTPNISNMAKNYVQVNFYLDRMTSIVVVEEQALSAINLAISFGWMVSLFLGSSFMTPFEIIYYFFVFVHQKIKALWPCNRVKKIKLRLVYIKS